MLLSSGVSISSMKALAWMKNPIVHMAVPMPCVHALPTLLLTHGFCPGMPMGERPVFGSAHLATLITMAGGSTGASCNQEVEGTNL